MNVTITEEQAISLQYYIGENKLIVSACFYLGYSLIFISELIASPARIIEAAEIVDTALSLGMLPTDYVNVREKN